MTPLLIVTGSVTGAYLLESQVGLIDKISSFIPVPADNPLLQMLVNAILFGLVSGLLFILINKVV